MQSKGLSRVFSNTTVQSINSSVLSFLYSPTLTSIHDYWKNHRYSSFMFNSFPLSLTSQIQSSLHLSRYQFRMRGGPFKALERVSVSVFGEEATPHRVCVFSVGRGRRLSAVVTSVSLSVATERAEGSSSTGAERECTGPRPHPYPSKHRSADPYLPSSAAIHPRPRFLVGHGRGKWRRCLISPFPSSASLDPRLRPRLRAPRASGPLAIEAGSRERHRGSG